jgi:FlaA1/EpsC-like NDP-sugar epimerase
MICKTSQDFMWQKSPWELSQYRIPSEIIQIDEIFLAIPNVPFYKMMKVIQTCQEVKVQYRFLSTLQDSIIPCSFNSSLIKTNIADFFKTQNIEITPRIIRRLLEGKKVLVTGASGALGVELCRRILGFSPPEPYHHWNATSRT